MSEKEKYAAEDAAAIKKLTNQILEAGENLATDLMANKWPFGLSDEEIMKEGYSFKSVNELFIALFIFFTNTYNAKAIAKKIYNLDEDDKFKESMDMEVPMGNVRKRKKIVETSVVEATIKVREMGTLNPETKLPFDLVNFRLIPA